MARLPAPRPPTSPWGLQHRAAGRGVGRPGRTSREGRHQGRGPDVRRRSDAACVRDSEYVTEPRVLMPAALPRPSSPSGPQSQRLLFADGGDLGRTLERRGTGARPYPTHLLGQWGRPSPVQPYLPGMSPPLTIRSGRSSSLPSDERPSDGALSQWQGVAEGGGRKLICRLVYFCSDLFLLVPSRREFRCFCPFVFVLSELDRLQ